MRNAILFTAAALVLVGMVGWGLCKDGNCFGGRTTGGTAAAGGATPAAPRGSDKNLVKITMWTSSEKLNYLKDVVPQFNKEEHTLPGTRRKIQVEAYTVNSGLMSAHLTNKIRDGVDFPTGVTPPHIVSPSVDHWLTRVNFQTGVPVFDIANTRPLALSPVVIATYEDMARALGWPQKELGWADIIALAKSPRGWADVPGAKAEWGKQPLLGWTDPFVSSTARSALFATYVAASGKPAAELLIDDVTNPGVQQYVADLQGAVDHYFPETLKLQTKLCAGPRFIHFAPVEEYILPWMKLGKVNSESVAGGEVKPCQPNPANKMVAIYPKEGTIWHNNPGAILQNVPWTDPEHQEAARVLVDYLLEPTQQAKAMEWGFRPANPSVPFGRYLTQEYGIDPAKPRVLLGNVEPAVAEEIMVRWQDVKKIGVVVLVLDTSGSMDGDKMKQAKVGALKFLDTVSANNHVGLVTFSTSVNQTIPVGPITKNKFDLAEGVNATRAIGGTALYDAVKRGVEIADAYPLSGEAIRGVILLSDGVNTNGSMQLCDVVKLARAGTEEKVACSPGNPPGDSKALKGSDLAVVTSHPIHVFSIAYGGDADLEVLRIFSEATNSTFKKATESNVLEVLETFGKYF